MPKLKIIKDDRESKTEIVDFDQGRHLPYDQNFSIVVEGESVRSFEELQRVAEEDRNKDIDFLVVRFIQIVSGGCS
jgi:hypothetical protein